jgi:hypothetical protein
MWGVYFAPFAPFKASGAALWGILTGFYGMGKALYDFVVMSLWFVYNLVLTPILIVKTIIYALLALIFHSLGFAYGVSWAIKSCMEMMCESRADKFARETALALALSLLPPPVKPEPAGGDN